MSPVSKRTLGITVGTRCNFECRHCLVDANLGSPFITGQEISRLVSEISGYRPETLVFTGGEPFLFIDEINAVLAGACGAGVKSIVVVTNGFFAESPEAAEREISRIGGLTGVQMSYDRFHLEFCAESNARNLYKACKRRGISFALVAAVETPADILFIKRAGIGNVPVAIQKILPIGRAKKNNIEYKYAAFEEEVLRKRCPNKGDIVYNCGRGFTTCCGFWASEADARQFIHSSIMEHIQSRFYQMVSRHTFGEILALTGLDPGELSAEHSSPCGICMKLLPIALRADI